MQSRNLPERSAETEDALTESDPTESASSTAPVLLSDPFLQLPTSDSVNVVWFTEFRGTQHIVEVGQGENAQRIAATTTELSRTREDADSQVQGRAFPEVTARRIWRHEATVAGLSEGDRPPYRVVSNDANGQTALSDYFTLSAAPSAGAPLKILLTSDHQLKPMTPANLQKVQETVGRVDAVFLAGDLVNIPDRASEWFDNAEGLGFFPGLQGRSQFDLEKDGTTTRYTGAPLIQNAPLFPAVGNHEVMGRFSEERSLKQQFTDTIPRAIALDLYADAGESEPTEDWIQDNSYNTRTYEEIFSLPTAVLPTGGTTETFYAATFGDVRLVSLYVTQVWRPPSLAADAKSRFRESDEALNNPEERGYGQHIFEDIRVGSPQYQWLQQELASDEFQNAKYKVVMLHHPVHTLGSNIVPAFTDPVAIDNRSDNGSLQSIQYEYPQDEDYIIRDLVPLLESADVQLVFYGHSHIWNRFVGPTGIHFLESSNVGNSYGAHLGDNPRAVPTDDAVAEAGDLSSFSEDYAALGDPYGLEPVMPSIAPLTDDAGADLPYVASNDITSFSILDTETGTISSYYFDTRQPDAEVVKFDEFSLD